MVARHDPRRDQSSEEDCLIVRRAKQKSRREHWERPVGTEACGLSDVRASLIANKGQPEPWRQLRGCGYRELIERRHLHLSSSLQRDRLSVSFSVGGTMTVLIDGVEPNIFPDVEDLDARDAGRNVEVFLDIRVEGKPTPVTVKLSYEQASELATLLEPFRKP
jgi:hypothetical protein